MRAALIAFLLTSGMWAQSVAEDLYKEAAAAQKAGDLKKAEFLLRQIKDANPTSAAWEVDLVNVLQAQNKQKEAIDFWRERMVGHEDSAWRRWEMGSLLLNAGRAADARAEYEAILRISNDRGDQGRAYVSLGEIHRRANEPDEAIAAFRKAKELTGRPNILLAQLLSDRGDHHGAIVEYREMLNQKIMTPIAQTWLAYELAEAGENLDEALALARQAVIAGPKNPDALHALGWVYFKNGEMESAEGMMVRSLMQEGGGGRAAWDHLAAVMDARAVWTDDRRELRKLLGGEPRGSALLRMKELLRSEAGGR